MFLGNYFTYFGGPGNIKCSLFPIVVYSNIMGALNIRRVGGVILGEGIKTLSQAADSYCRTAHFGGWGLLFS